MDDGFTGMEFGTAVIEVEGPHFIDIFEFDDSQGSFSISSNRLLAQYVDSDDGRKIAVGDTVLASMDYPGYIDFFDLELKEGETLSIVADTMNFDPVMLIAFPNAAEDQEVTDDDSGGGIFGLNSKIIYQAPQDGEYFISVRILPGSMWVATFSQCQSRHRILSPLLFPTRRLPSRAISSLWNSMKAIGFRSLYSIQWDGNH